MPRLVGHVASTGVGGKKQNLSQTFLGENGTGNIIQEDIIIIIITAILGTSHIRKVLQAET
jgi:hypothetical protein